MNNIIANNTAALKETTADAWGKANDRRGVGYTEVAVEFVKNHPIGTLLTTDEFDTWSHNRKLLMVPSKDAPKNSDAWLGHLQRRHIVRGRLNKAATHPRMTEMGSTPFVLVAHAGGFEVRAPHTAIGKAELPRKFKTLVETKRKQLQYLMQSADWPALPPHERAVAETIHDDIDNFADDVNIAADRISRKLAKLEHRIQKGIDAGSIVPANGGFKQLLAPDAIVDDGIEID